MTTSRKTALRLRVLCLCLTLLVLFLFRSLPAHRRFIAATAPTAALTVRITGVDRSPGFVPDLLTVHAGDTVIFTNVATPGATYMVVASDQSFASPAIAPGQQWSHVFTQIGQIEYTDPAHASLMVGLITVVPASTPLLPTPRPEARATAIAQLTHPKGNGSTGSSRSFLPSGISLPLVIAGVLALVALVGVGAALITRRSRRRHVAR